jgi:hypothetical protein
MTIVEMKLIRIIGILLLQIFTQSLYSQEAGKLRMDLNIDLGRSLNYKNLELGAGVSVNPAYMITDNQKVGINVSVFAILKNLEIKEYTERQALTSILGTYDYYFGQQNNFSFSIGGGIGLYQIDHTISQLLLYPSGKTIYQNDVIFAGYRPGIMIRPAWEYGKFRLGLECDFVPSYTYESTITNQLVSNENIFFKWNLGMFLGGGHHKKRRNWYRN